MKGIRRIGSGAGIVLATCSGTIAADLPPNLPLKASAVYDWTGFYFGGHFGYGAGSFGQGTNPFPEQGVFLPHSATGLIGGYQTGYNRQFANHVVLGVEADATFPSAPDAPALTPAPSTQRLTISALCAAVGYAFGPWMPYMTGGFAWGHTHITINDGIGTIISALGSATVLSEFWKLTMPTQSTRMLRSQETIS